MQITNEIKVKVFAQYFGQQFKSNAGSFNFEKIQSSGELDFGYTINEVKLILKPISKITDEDAINIAQMCYLGDYPEITGKKIVKGLFEEFKNPYENNPTTIVKIHQYLQSKGYDLPHYLLGGKTLQEAGLAIYE